jgi:hypothetical protein
LRNFNDFISYEKIKSIIINKIHNFVNTLQFSNINEILDNYPNINLQKINEDDINEIDENLIYIFFNNIVVLYSYLKYRRKIILNINLNNYELFRKIILKKFSLKNFNINLLNLVENEVLIHSNGYYKFNELI